MSADWTGGAINAGFRVELALEDDAGPIVALRDAAARWQRTVGIDQWVPGEVSTDEVAAQIVAHEWHVVRRRQEVLASLRVLADDRDIWGAQTEAAIYVHGLVVRRDMSGQHLGRDLLRWVEAQAVTSKQQFATGLRCAQHPVARLLRAVGFR